MYLLLSLNFLELLKTILTFQLLLVFKPWSKQISHYTGSTSMQLRTVWLPSGDSKPQKSVDELCMEEILPTATVQDETLMDLVYIIPWIVCRYLPAYSIFQKSIVHHIPHTFSQEMTQRLEKVHCTEFPAKILFL